MSLFTKLFGKKKNQADHQVEASKLKKQIERKSIDASGKVTTSTEFITPKQRTYSKSFALRKEQITITNFNKKLTNVYKTDGYSSANKLFQEFYKNNRSQIEFEDARRLVNNFINIKRKEKFSAQDIRVMIDSRLTDYSEFSELENIVGIAKMYNKFDINMALEFVSNYSRQHEGSSVNVTKLVELIALESEYLIKLGKFDEAFRNLRRTSILLPKLDQFDYIRWSGRISSMNAEICYSENNPKYDGFLFYEYSRFLLTLLSEIASFPICPNFFRWKSENMESKWPLYGDKRIDKALEALEVTETKDNMLHELFVFGYNKLPEIYGIPAEYNTREKIDRTFETASENYESFSKMNRIGEELKAKFLDVEVYEIHTKVKAILQKYCNANNQT